MDWSDLYIGTAVASAAVMALRCAQLTRIQGTDPVRASSYVDQITAASLVLTVALGAQIASS